MQEGLCQVTCWCSVSMNDDGDVLEVEMIGVAHFVGWVPKNGLDDDRVLGYSVNTQVFGSERPRHPSHSSPREGGTIAGDSDERRA